MGFPTKAIRQQAVMIRRVTKKGVAPHYIIDGNSNFGHNQRCQLRRCKRTTTVRRRILSKLKVVKNLPGNTKGAHVANALSVDAGIRVSKVYAKRVLGDATGLTKAAFREEFTKLGCFIDYMNSEGNAHAFVHSCVGRTAPAEFE